MTGRNKNKVDELWGEIFSNVFTAYFFLHEGQGELWNRKKILRKKNKSNRK